MLSVPRSRIPLRSPYSLQLAVACPGGQCPTVVFVAKIPMASKCIALDLRPAWEHHGVLPQAGFVRELLRASFCVTIWVNQTPPSLAWLLETCAFQVCGSQTEGLVTPGWQRSWEASEQANRNKKWRDIFFHQCLIWGGLVWAQNLGEGRFRSESRPQ